MKWDVPKDTLNGWQTMLDNLGRAAGLFNSALSDVSLGNKELLVPDVIQYMMTLESLIERLSDSISTELGRS